MGVDELKVGFNRRTAGYEAGELVFVYREGGNVSPDPYANRAHMSTSAALEDPADEIYRRIGAEVRTQRQAQMLAQQPAATEEQRKMGRATGRERVCQYVKISRGAVS